MSHDGPAPRYGITFGASLLYPDFWRQRQAEAAAPRLRLAGSVDGVVRLVRRYGVVPVSSMTLPARSRAS